MAIFMLSLAGLPPLAGFFGKFYLFSAAMRAGGNHGLLWLVALALFGSLISLYYYLLVLKVIFVDPTRGWSCEDRARFPATGIVRRARGGRCPARRHPGRARRPDRNALH